MKRAHWLSVLELGVPVAIIAALWIVSRGSESLYFPPLQEIAARSWENWVGSRAATDVIPSLQRLGAGYVIACFVGVGAGLLLGLIPPVRHLIEPMVHFVRSIPSPAVLPVAILLLGIGDAMKICIIAFVATWPVLLNTLGGLDETDPLLVETTRVYRVRGLRRVLMVSIPAASPHIVAGMRTSLSLAVIVMVISEMVGSTNGIGYFTLQSQRGFAITDMWTGIVFLGLLGYVLNVSFALLERRVLRWHHERQKV